ncbi:MAG: hypothetical protein A3E36_03790 [Candidatus Andersenbacteria bacterium RIFCSPHIGHO2_12_FULL_45_11b]|uniref:Isopentenyl phosphate kinase n=1 Tax=Candidatus Andersenbacteria bacterium RIFCSPHIGHO2_12_FULL_45_11b TaxID=1797282 RepID=A0A1G1X9P7_9BACT|nr:MAG: hypothetical protein A3E36_03790 [Candidatus Andersenbacteria bacterium RIFCSPHIGHO2_12_FULL_45_11b]
MELWIIKLGGSIITEKQNGIPVGRTRLVSQLCEKIALFLQMNPNIRILLLHGAGSVGHPLAKEYNLSDMPLNTKRTYGMAKTILAMRGLSNEISLALQECNVPAIPMQTSSMFYRDEDGRLIFAGQKIMERMLENRSLPVLSGDVVSTANNMSSIASADELAVVCAKAWKATRILFATDVDGIYANFPPAPSETYLQNITRDDIQRIITETDMPHNSQDVTKGMKGKLSALLAMQSVQVSVFNGFDSKNLELALNKQPVGTNIQL